MNDQKYFLYARKSTDEDDDSTELVAGRAQPALSGSTALTTGLAEGPALSVAEGSIESQLTELREFARKERLKIAVC